jgi:hypothetical protein
MISRPSRIRAVLYAHCALMACVSVLAYLEVIAGRPASFRWLASSKPGQGVYLVLMWSAWCFPAILADLCHGRVRIPRMLLIILVDLILALLQFFIFMLMFPVRY